MFRLNNYRNYSGVILVPPAVAGGEKGKEARTPRAPARAYRPPDGVCVPRHPLLRSYPQEILKKRLLDN